MSIKKNSNQDPGFLISLGAVFVMYNLLEAAEEVIAQVPTDHPIYKEAVQVQMDIHFRKQNYPEVINLAENHLKQADIPEWLATRIGTAYYHLGRLGEAKAYLLKGMEDFPSNSQVIDKLRSLRSRSPKQKMEDLIKAVLQNFLTPHVALDCIAPILSEGRFVTCCFGDQLFPDGLPKNKGLSQKDVFLEFAANLYERFGILSAFLPYIQLFPDQCVSLRKIYFSFDRSVYDQVERIRQASWNDFEKEANGSTFRLNYLELEGHLLGYPRCCVDWMLTHRRNNQLPELETLKTLIEEELTALSHQDYPLPPESAYFAFEFYPCSPWCHAAEEVGERILRKYMKMGNELPELYRHHVLPFNKTKIFYPGVPYTEYVKKFNDTISEAFKLRELKKTSRDFEWDDRKITEGLNERPTLKESEDVLLFWPFKKEEKEHIH